VSITANATLVSLRRGRVALGLIVRLAPSVEIAGIAKASGHDFLFIDMQHGGMSIESTIAVCHGALATGVTPLVRVPGHEAFHAGRVLDNGAMGIIVPDVETADEARQAVLNCRFPPLGRRSVAAVYPQLGYGAYSTAEATRILNEQTMLVVMIESGRGIDNWRRSPPCPVSTSSTSARTIC
jgi:2-keto-3-deoxy-L-rhamnonate aldolase RhmA